MAERAIANSEFGKALQFVEQGLVIDPHNDRLLKLETEAKAGLSALVDGHTAQAEEELNAIQNTSEAEQYKLQAEFILHELQANIQVYGSNSVLSGATPANVDLALQYIDRSLEYFPENPVYLNLKALLLMEGKGDRQRAIELLERAARNSPRDINIQNNLQGAKTSSSCFIATAAFGSPMAQQVRTLRLWRDERLLTTYSGRKFVKFYYRFSPPLATVIANHPALKQITRMLLTPLVNRIVARYAAKRI